MSEVRNFQLTSGFRLPALSQSQEKEIKQAFVTLFNTLSLQLAISIE